MQPAAALLSRAVVHCGGEPQCLRFRNQSVQSCHRNVGAPDARGCPPQPGKGRWTGQKSGGLPAHAAGPAPAWGSRGRQLGFRTAARSGAVWAARPHRKEPRSPQLPLQPGAAAWLCGLADRQAGTQPQVGPAWGVRKKGAAHWTWLSRKALPTSASCGTSQAGAGAGAGWGEASAVASPAALAAVKRGGTRGMNSHSRRPSPHPICVAALLASLLWHATGSRHSRHSSCPRTCMGML
jgi:hypothetical protein